MLVTGSYSNAGSVQQKIERLAKIYLAIQPSPAGRQNLNNGILSVLHIKELSEGATHGPCARH